MPPKPAPAASELDESLAELAALFPETESVSRGNIVITIPVMPVSDLAKVCTIAIPAIKDADPTLTLQAILGQNLDVAVQVVSIGVGKSAAYLGAMPPDFFAECLEALVRKNADFFRERVQATLALLYAEMAPPGPAP